MNEEKPDPAGWADWLLFALALVCLLGVIFAALVMVTRSP